MRWLAVVAVVAVAAGGAAGCSPATDGQDAPVEPPVCRTLTTFGTGATCDEKTPGASSCAGGQGFCAGGWLCFSAPQVAFCSCDTDDDCERRTQYVNQARGLRKLAPIANLCLAGRCQGL